MYLRLLNWLCFKEVAKLEKCKEAFIKNTHSSDLTAGKYYECAPEKVLDKYSLQASAVSFLPARFHCCYFLDVGISEEFLVVHREPVKKKMSRPKMVHEFGLAK
jgi:hypothetical protein